MLLQKDPSLEEQICYELAVKPALSAKKIHSTIRARGRSYSLRAVYKELTKLEQKEIVYKVKKQYRLRLTWLINLNALVEHAFEAYTDPDHMAGLLLREKGKNIQHFTNLRRLDLYWIQLMMALVKVYDDQPLFLWCPYQWFHLVHDYSITQFYRAEDLASAKRYHIFGSDSYLARLALKTFPKNGEYSFAKSPFDHEKTTNYTVIGEHVITVKLDRKITEKIANLFDSVKCKADIDDQEMADIFSSKVRASVCIELNPLKAKKLKKKFVNYFAI